MTSYKMDDNPDSPTYGKVKRQVLPPLLPENCYVPIEGLIEWLERMDGRYVWCGKCLCVREAGDYKAHLVIHSKGWEGGDNYQRPAAVSA